MTGLAAPSQPDFFYANSILGLRHKHLHGLMSSNWTSLSKSARHKPIVHTYDDWTVQVSNDTGHGLATIWDQDILIFIISQLVWARNNDQPTSSQIRFNAHQLNRFLRPAASRRSRPNVEYYDMTWAALLRLHTTRIETTYKPINHPTTRDTVSSFFWISQIERTRYRDSADFTGYTITLDPFIYNWINDPQNVLTLDPQYFSITSGLGRFMYLWARKALGTRDDIWTERLSTFHERSASLDPMPQFSHRVRREIARASVPSYRFEIRTGLHGPEIAVTARSPSEMLNRPLISR